MRAMWKGFITFGLVTIPVAVGIAQQRRDVSFRTLSRESGVPVRQRRWDPVADREVGPDDVVKGYEVAKGRYVTVEEGELDRFAARQEKTIEILQFVELPELDPVYFEKAYWMEPQERAERPYVLLLQAMERAGKGALGRFVLSTREHLVLLRPFDGMLALQTLYYPEDLRMRDHDEVADRLKGIEAREDELAMAEQLISALTRPFVPEDWQNATRRALVEFLEAKADGAVVEAPEEEAEPAPVVDLMAALKASLAAAGPIAAEEEAAPAKAAPRRRTRKAS